MEEEKALFLLVELVLRRCSSRHGHVALDGRFEVCGLRFWFPTRQGISALRITGNSPPNLFSSVTILNPMARRHSNHTVQCLKAMLTNYYVPH